MGIISRYDQRLISHLGIHQQLSNIISVYIVNTNLLPFLTE